MAEVKDYLTSRPADTPYGTKLDKVSAILAKLGNPQDKIPAIHVAGTSGKGSTAYYAAALLRQAGYSVGLNVSPHIVDVSERSQVNGEPLPADVYCEYFTRFTDLLQTLGASVTYTECLYMFSFWLFAQLNLDYMVIEVGVGGRYDVTNAMHRTDKVCVITDIGYDHMTILGDTLEAIAGAKAGIIQQDNDVVMYNQSSEIMDAIHEEVKQHNASLQVIHDASYPEFVLPLPLFQRRNWLLAEAAVTTRLLRDHRPKLGLAAQVAAVQIKVPGRFEVFKSRYETIILDGAHNAQKVHTLIESVRAYNGRHKVVSLVAFSQHKTAVVKESLQELETMSSRIFMTEFKVAFNGWLQSMEASSLKGYLRHTPGVVNANPTEALAAARRYAKSVGQTLVITGSIYLVSALRPILLKTFKNQH